jgi:hypothetical protein
MGGPSASFLLWCQANKQVLSALARDRGGSVAGWVLQKSIRGQARICRSSSF